MVALHDELSFQFRLQQLDSQHRLRYDNLMQWLKTQKAALPDVATVTSSGQARNALKHLDSYAKVTAASIYRLNNAGKSCHQEER